MKFKIFSEAFKWYRKSALNGFTDAEYNVGACYFLGKGVTQNRAEAVKWLTKAAQHGNQHAINTLNLLHQEEERTRRLAQQNKAKRQAQTKRQTQTQRKVSSQKKKPANNTYSQAEIDAAMAQAELLTALTSAFIGDTWGLNGDSGYGYNDGTSNSGNSWYNCDDCNGTGKCKLCNGSGAMRAYVTCTDCHGSGKCERCNGTGHSGALLDWTW